MNVVVLGAGAFGCTIANVLCENNHNVTLWGHLQSDLDNLQTKMVIPHIPEAKLDKRIKMNADITCVNSADIVVFVVPSFALRQTAKMINQIVTKPITYVICTKGLEVDTMQSGYQIIGEEIKLIKGNVILSGPTHAEELAVKKYTTIVSTSESEEARILVQWVFNNSYLRVYTNDDIKGVEILGAAKNVLAIAAGICDAHPKLGDNAKAAILTRGLRELKIIGDHENCNGDTFYGLTGLGDLIVTATSKHSRNRGFGELIGSGLTSSEAKDKIGMVVEGLYSVKAIHQLKEKYKLDLPILESIYMCLYENTPIENIILRLISREVKDEK